MSIQLFQYPEHMSVDSYILFGFPRAVAKDWGLRIFHGYY